MNSMTRNNNPLGISDQTFPGVAYIENQNLLNYLDPALRSLNAAHLDAGQCLIQLLRDRSHLGHAAREADLIAMIYDLADRRDDSCGTAKATLCEILYFIEVNPRVPRRPVRGNPLLRRAENDG